jgi:hypothetical protein
VARDRHRRTVRRSQTSDGIVMATLHMLDWAGARAMESWTGVVGLL